MAKKSKKLILKILEKNERIFQEPYHMHFRPIAFLPMLFLLSFSCSNGSQTSQAGSTNEMITYQNSSPADWSRVRTALNSLDERVKQSLDARFVLFLEKQIEQKKLDKAYFPRVYSQLEQNSQQLPTFPGMELLLQHLSLFDQKALPYQVYLPQDLSTSMPVLVFMGKPEEFPADVQKVPAVQLFVPSRPGMNYQLISEADFLNTLEDFKNLYPFLSKSPFYLVGQGEHADSALLMANNYYSRFEGLAFSGGKIGVDLRNLHLLPIVHYPSPEADNSFPLGGRKLIQMLNKRGNAKAQYATRDLARVLNDLIRSKKDTLPISNYSFSDYQYANVTPWLKVISKKSEFDPVNVTLEVKGDVLFIEGFNIASCEIDRFHPSFPYKDISRIRLNQHLFSFPANRGKVYVGSNSIEPVWNHKSYYPSGFNNFFRNEPVYIVYQSEQASKEYLQKVRTLANRLARLEFVGFPQFQAKLPMISLEEYITKDLPDHRAIIIAQENLARKVLQVSSDYLPISRQGQHINVFEKALLPDSASYAYGMIYPPEAKGKLKLALVLCSDDADGLQALQSHYTMATSFEDPADLILWQKKPKDPSYIRTFTTCFNDSWGSSYKSKTLLTTPEFSEKVWKFYLKKLLIDKSGTENLILPPLVDSFMNVPTKLSYESISDFVPNKYFAKIRLSSWRSTGIVNKLLEQMKGPVYLSMGNLLEFAPDTKKPRFNKAEIKKYRDITFLIEAKQLQTLDKTELEEIDFEILPFSLRDMLLDKVLTDKASLGKDLITLSNQFYPDKEQIGQFVESQSEWEF